MIVTSTPLRVSFLGGGSDIPAFYEKTGPGCTVSTTIDKFIHVVVNRADYGIKVMTDGYYEGDGWKDVQDARVRSVMAVMNYDSALEIASFSDIPSYGTGMGSSSAFTVGLIGAIAQLQGKALPDDAVAELACHVEIEMVGDPIGKQDQYAAAITGLNCYRFTEGRVTWDPVDIVDLEDWCRLYYTMRSRKASDILSRQNELLENDAETRKKVNEMAGLARTIGTDGYGRAGDRPVMVAALANAMRSSWETKKSLVVGITDDHIDRICAEGTAAGAKSCKILGAGNGGYVLFICPPQKGLVLDTIMREKMLLRPIPFKFWRKP